MTLNRPLNAALGAIAVLGAATLALSQGTPSANAAKAPDIAAKGEPVLLELFTSQGCSSCPPADRLAEKLATHPDLVLLDGRAPNLAPARSRPEVAQAALLPRSQCSLTPRKVGCGSKPVCVRRCLACHPLACLCAQSHSRGCCPMRGVH